MSENKTKIWRVNKDSKAGVMLNDDTVVMASNDKNFLAVGPTGVTISGPVNFMTTSENIRSGGMFIQMNDMVKMMPSTIVSPIPPNIPMPPIAIFAYVALFLPALLELSN